MLLVVTIAVQAPVRALAGSQAPHTPDYLSEVKIAMGDNAEKDLDSYIIFKDEKGEAFDLNKGAGGGWGSQGDKRVILGYKTTKKQNEAITDLAVMNMKGGYDVQEYDALMKSYIGSQLSPFIDKFLTAINEYRENLRSDDEVNHTRAEYVRGILNKFTDNDCNGAGLGDLLINETIYEIAKPQFDMLSDNDKQEIGIVGVNARVRNTVPEGEKNQHCDILTLFAQADGQIMILIYDLITRGADTNENSWIERFSELTPDVFWDSYDMSAQDAKIQVAKEYEDDARILIQNWDTFREFLLDASENVGTLQSMDLPDHEGAAAKLNALNENSSDEELVEAFAKGVITQLEQEIVFDLAESITTADYLKSIDYDDGTMYDFFTRSSTDFEGDLTPLYPLIASLSEGQRDEALEMEKNRANARLLSTKSIILWAVTGVAAIGFIRSLVNLGIKDIAYAEAVDKLKDIIARNPAREGAVKDFGRSLRFGRSPEGDLIVSSNASGSGEPLTVQVHREWVSRIAAANKTAAWMSAGYAAALVILAGVSAYLTWQDMKAFYKVDFIPIPHYMVDETAITYYNKDGQKLVKENHAAYYKAVACSRPENDKNYKILGDCADLNGDVGQQWVALYACRDNKACQPILADSLKAVVGSSEVPAGYETGIHMFGSDAAFNMNNKMYDWNQSAKSIYVYFQIDKEASVSSSTSGSAFTAGWIVLVAVLGAVLGAAVTAVSMTVVRKKRYLDINT